MMQFFISMDRIIDLNVNVLIIGESGTGKELIARAIHEGSSYKDGPFVAVNCAGIATDIADSLLFGHVKGAFTGANIEHIGFFEQSNHGTIFLYEIGGLNIEVQAKHLRVIEDGQVRRVGGRTENQPDFRIISATNRELSDELGEMTFFPDAMKSLELREWPGNVRELRSYVQRLALQSMDSVIDYADVIQTANQENKISESCSDTEIIPLEQLERREIEKAYHHFNGEIGRAALSLGTSRATLYRKLKLYKLI